MKNKFSVILFIICFNFIYTNSNSQGSLSFVRGDVRGPGNCSQLQIGIQYDGLSTWDHIYLELFDITNNQPSYFPGGCSGGLLISNFPPNQNYYEPYCLFVYPGSWRIIGTVVRPGVGTILTSAPLIVNFNPDYPHNTFYSMSIPVSCRNCNDGELAFVRVYTDYCHQWDIELYRDGELLLTRPLLSDEKVIFFSGLSAGHYTINWGYYLTGTRITRYVDNEIIEKPVEAKITTYIYGRRRHNNLTFGNEGDNNSNVSDTAIVYLRNVTPPYDFVDTSKSALDSAGKGVFNFHNADVGTPYYIVATHRNSLETWSSSGQVFGSDSLMNYDFSTSASQAYGNNMVLVDGEWTFYSGDVNQDGVIDLLDLTLVYNDASTFVTGYVVSDVTGDSIVDLDDMLIVYENAYRFVAVMRP